MALGSRPSHHARQEGRQCTWNLTTCECWLSRIGRTYCSNREVAWGLRPEAECQDLHGLDLPGGDLIWVLQPPACFLMEASPVDGTLKCTLKLRECPVAGSRLCQVFAPVSTINIQVINMTASKMVNYLYVGSSWQEFSTEGKKSSSG